MTDWGFAAQVAGIGFLTVFVVLGILSLVIWLVSLLILKIVRRQDGGGKGEGV